MSEWGTVCGRGQWILLCLPEGLQVSSIHHYFYILTSVELTPIHQWSRITLHLLKDFLKHTFFCSGGTLYSISEEVEDLLRCVLTWIRTLECLTLLMQLRRMNCFCCDFPHSEVIFDKSCLNWGFEQNLSFLQLFSPLLDSRSIQMITLGNSFYSL